VNYCGEIVRLTRAEGRQNKSSPEFYLNPQVKLRGHVIGTLSLFALAGQAKNYCLIIVVLAGCDGPTPPPEAVALFETEATFRFAWLMV
jgi:hypothetical protein